LPGFVRGLGDPHVRDLRFMDINGAALDGAKLRHTVLLSNRGNTKTYSFKRMVQRRILSNAWYKGVFFQTHGTKAYSFKRMVQRRIPSNAWYKGVFPQRHSTKAYSFKGIFLF
jgi:hypothetical protein